MRRSNLFFLKCAIIIFSCLFFSCAQIVSPGGGKKDVTPPRVMKYMPDSGQTNFVSREMEITFDEFIQFKDLNNQLVISPPLKNNPDITIKNKSLKIAFNRKDTLKPNTTYCFSFGNSIQDITENNAIENFKYIFSTGDFIDSLTVIGKAENGFNHTFEKGILVMLYNSTNDSVVYKQLPDYFSKTNSDGLFKINNVRDGKYKLFALKDGNANYKYDEGESIGFIDGLIDTKQNRNILIDFFSEVPKRLFLKKSIYDSFGKIVFIFNKNAEEVKVEPLNYKFPDEDTLLEFSKNKDTLTYWFRNITQENLKLRLINGNSILDTLEYKLITKEEAIKSKKHPLKLTVLNSINGNQNFDLGKEIKLIVSHPIESDNQFEHFYFKEGENNFKTKGDLNFQKSTLSTLVLSESINDTLKGKKYIFNYHILPPTILEMKPIVLSKENTNYNLFIAPGAFTDFFGVSNDTIKMNFKTREEKYYGSVKLKLNISETKGQYILQLLDEKENVIRESIVDNGKVINYTYLSPQQYKLKIIFDDNKNAKWDTGNHLQKLQPEKVMYYNGAINIRSNWDLDLIWEIINEK